MQEANERTTGLCLTRKVDESVTLVTQDGVITIQVIRIQGQRVRLRFMAPDSVQISRADYEEFGGQKGPFPGVPR